MNHSLHLPFCIVALVILMAASGQAYAQADGSRFEPADCPAGVPEISDIECGYLVVPEDYGDPAGDTIRLPVVILQSLSRDPAPDPLVYMTGLPGARMDAAVPALAKSAARGERDIIILEQRGAGSAIPSLHCDASLLGNDAIACLESLKEMDIDLSLYTSEAMVADLDSLRQALDYEEWNLFGHSYSALLMLRALQIDPEGIRTIILDSVQPPATTLHETVSANYAQALETFFDECAIDPSCAAAYPNLAEQFYSLVNHLNDEPVTLIISRPTGEQVEVEIDGNWILAQTFDALYGHVDPADPLAYWPLLISRLSQGETELLRPWITQPVIDWEEILTFGLYFTAICQDQFPAASPGALAEQAAGYPELEGWAQTAFARKICKTWNLPASRGMVDSLTASDIPTLILAGQHDPITPPKWGKETAETLGNSYFYEFPNMGNWVSAGNPCAQQMVAAFLDNPDVPPESNCIVGDGQGRYVLPEDIYFGPEIYRYLNDTGAGGPRAPLAAALWFSLFLFVAELIYVAVILIRRLVLGTRMAETGGRVARVAHLLAALVAIANLAFFLALTQLLNRLAVATPLVLRFGVPIQYGPLMTIPLLTEILTAAMLVIAFLAWIMGYWSNFQRTFYSLVTLAAVIFSSLMAN